VPVAATGVTEITCLTVWWGERLSHEVPPALRGALPGQRCGTWLGPLVPGASTATLSNSQCTVNGSGTAVAGSGSTLTLNLALTAGSDHAACVQGRVEDWRWSLIRPWWVTDRLIPTRL
jgi:hypothetical protein